LNHAGVSFAKKGINYRLECIINYQQPSMANQTSDISAVAKLVVIIDELYSQQSDKRLISIQNNCFLFLAIILILL